VKKARRKAGEAIVKEEIVALLGAGQSLQEETIEK